MSTYYRFRSAERLLGQPAMGGSPAVPGELDELTIYFASPQELNDPLEGHRETYFEGDIIVWRNLIKHYSLLLYVSVVDVYFNEGNGDVVEVKHRPHSFSPEAQEIIRSFTREILANSAITDYLAAIAATGRRVIRPELSAHLMTLHTCILGYVMCGLEGHIDKAEIEKVSRARENSTAYISMRAKDIEAEGSQPDSAIYKNIRSRIRQQGIRGAAAREVEISKGLLQILVHFPEKFCEQIEYLVYPRWFVACFMEDCSNSAIWGSYGNNHKGVCLVYQSKQDRGVPTLTLSKLPFEYIKARNYGRPKDQYFLNMPMQVPLAKINYDRKYTSPNFFTSLLNEEDDWLLSYWYSNENQEISKCASWLNEDRESIYKDYTKLFQRSVTTKTNHWVNETERRAIICGFAWSREERQVKYSFSELEGLIFGISTSDEIKAQIIKKIAEHCVKHRRSDFKFYQARFDESYENIVHDHLDYIKFNQDGTLNVDP